jgi:hypothetical protein
MYSTLRVARSGVKGYPDPISKAMINIAQMSHKAKWRMSSKRGEVCCSYGGGIKKKPPIWETDRR